MGKPPPLPLGELIETIDEQRFNGEIDVETAAESAEITKCKLLASFNWASNGKLYFPGKITTVKALAYFRMSRQVLTLSRYAFAMEATDESS